MVEQEIDAICQMIEGDAEFVVDLDMWNLDINLRRVCGISLETLLTWVEEVE